MNDQPNAYDAVLADLRAKREQIDRAIVLLEALREGVTVPYVPPPGGTPTILGSGTIRNGELPAGTFHGMSIEAAIKKLLQIRKRPMSATEMVPDLRQGGLHMQSETPANTIASVLSRANKPGGEIVRVRRGMWGLQEWNPTQRFKRGED